MRTLFRHIYLLILGFFRTIKPGIHIINSHYVTPQILKDQDKETLEHFIKYLNERYKLISIQEATHLIMNKQFPFNETMVALTFDDGFEECYTIIAPLLEKYNCRGAFFINANYIDSNEDYQTKFHDRINIYTKKPMSWKQIKDLHNRGHVIGAHTLDHVDMAKLDEKELEFQLEENKRILETKLDYSCDYFAWTYGKVQHFPQIALEKTKKHHKYIFSGTNYKHYFSMNNDVINRRHIEPFWPKKHVDYFLSIKKKI